MKNFFVIVFLFLPFLHAMSQEVSCSEVQDFIKANGYANGTVSSYTLDSEWLHEVKAYTYDYKIYIIAKIKPSEYSYQTKSYIFCGIPSMNWSNFRYGGFGDSESYGERFHKYIFKYKCDCF